jgi:hypothetical protein
MAGEFRSSGAVQCKSKEVQEEEPVDVHKDRWMGVVDGQFVIIGGGWTGTNCDSTNQSE